MNQQLGPRAQRARLGGELRRLRRLAGLSGRDVAAQVRVGQASVSRIENGQQVPSVPEVRSWAAAVAASDDQTDVLVAYTEAALNEVDTWRSRQPTEGLSGMQTDVGALEATSGVLRVLQPVLVPGLLQTPEYARQVFTLVDVVGRPGRDFDDAVAARVERQRILHDRSRRFEVVVTEQALRNRVAPPPVLAAQLDRVAEVSRFDNVEVGVVPADAVLPAVPWVGFNLYDDRAGGEPAFVAVELPHAGLTASDPRDVDLYRGQLRQLRGVAVFDDEARELLMQLRRRLV